MKIYAGSLSPRIVALHVAGMNTGAIAREVGCTRPNVIQTLKRKNMWTGRVAPLPRQLHDWLCREAANSGTDADTMARAMLVDAIHEAMEAERVK